MFGEPYRLSVAAERALLGSTVSVALGFPFLTDLLGTAWHVGFSDVNRYVHFVPPEGERISLGVERRFWDVEARPDEGKKGADRGIDGRPKIEPLGFKLYHYPPRPFVETGCPIH